ncbi:hypothetical protein JAO10_33825 [Burkholderia contaminans]|uniref:Uncharacterized protein n=1 Tax=Burkholderia cenocepacia TaxID=95486 RepID=A0ABD4UET2_9BURK|nr:MULTISPECIES: hypothetical protein [Burkholderia]MBH9725302.1 hypothetical protein [Burkholderia contaminans]MBR8094561.1 hypothetical protein [Burkholderia cenocepacia]MBS6359034.1 hypothetical protein [Burkholderia sp.]MBY4714728.1 hypothetical protein [Burkholderia cepacia]MBY4740668.1 hypothetical protein [Burkholderia cepacia]
MNSTLPPIENEGAFRIMAQSRVSNGRGGYVIEIRRRRQGLFDVVFGLDELEDLLRKHGCADVVDIDSGMKLEVHDVYGRMTVFSPGVMSSIVATAATIITMASDGKFVQRTRKPIPLRSNIDIERVDQVAVVIDRDEGGCSVTNDIFAVVDHLLRNGHVRENDAFVYRDSMKVYDGVQVINGVFGRFIALQETDAMRAVTRLREKVVSRS